MYYLEAPNSCPAKIRKSKDARIFLAGGISGTPNWQREMANELSPLDIIVYNPRRENYPSDPRAVKQQVLWEFDHLRDADIISYWFPRESICPIVLYELGAWSMTDKPIFIGVHPDYPRRQDVEIQTSLSRPDVKIVYSLDDLVDQIFWYFGG